MFATDLFKENGSTHSLGIIKAQNMINKLGTGNVTLISCSADSLPFTDNYFDFVFSSSALEHMEDRGSVLNEIKRVLKTNGYLILILPTHMPSIYAFPHVLLYALVRTWKLLSQKNSQASSDISLVNRFKKGHRSFPLPEPHGNYPNIFKELSQQFPQKWINLIGKSGFKVIECFPTCLLPWLLIEPFSTDIGSRLYRFTKKIHTGVFNRFSFLGYLDCFIAVKNY